MSEDFEMVARVGDPITSVAIPKQPYNITPLEYYSKLANGATLILLSTMEIISEGDTDVADALTDLIAKTVKAEIRERTKDE